jgi:hypothetical protein
VHTCSHHMTAAGWSPQGRVWRHTSGFMYGRSCWRLVDQSLAEWWTSYGWVLKVTGCVGVPCMYPQTVSSVHPYGPCLCYFQLLHWEHATGSYHSAPLLHSHTAHWDRLHSARAL